MSEQQNVPKKFITDSPKLNFFLGLIVGVAIISTLGFAGLTLTRPGNQPSTAGDKTAQENTNQPVADQDEQKPVDLKIVETDHVLGNRNAPVKIFEFSDFQCPYCARHHTTLRQIVAEYSDKVAWIFKQFPIASHPLGMPGALASECADEQGKFWEMADKIFTNQETLTADSFEEFASELGMNVDQYKTCLAQEKYRDKILVDYNLGLDSGVRGTPSNFINNQMLAGAVPYENIKEIIDGLLK